MLQYCSLSSYKKKIHFKKKKILYISCVAIMTSVRKEIVNIFSWSRRDLSGRIYWAADSFLHCLKSG